MILRSWLKNIRRQMSPQPRRNSWNIRNGSASIAAVESLESRRMFSNHAPVGTMGTVTAFENSAYVIKAADFGFTDPNDQPPNSLLSVKLTLLPAAGTISLSNVAVTVNQMITAVDINAGKLKFTPNSNLSGGPLFLCKFQVRDNGGTANGGVDTDPTAKVLYVNIKIPDHAPVGTAKTVTFLEDSSYAFKSADFGFSDPNDSPSNSLLAVKIAALPSAGSLTDNGVAVTAGAHVLLADFTAGKLKFTPVANKNGIAYSSFTFQVQDNGGTAGGGVDTDPTARKMTISVTSVNDAPVGTAKTVTTGKNTTYVFKTADFGFTDPNDNPANSVLTVIMSTVPSVGSLTDNGSVVTAGEKIAVADITGGKLIFAPALNGTGAAYASFTFQVQDNGGTANGGSDTDATPRKMTIRVTTASIGPEVHVNNSTTGFQSDQDIAMDSHGDYVIVWTTWYNVDIKARRYNSSGVAQGNEFFVNTFTHDFQSAPAIAMDANGNFVVVWQSSLQYDSGYSIMAKRYNAQGVALGADFVVNTSTTLDQRNPAIAMDSTGSFVITWMSDVQGIGNGVYAQRYTAAGAAQGNEFKVNTGATGPQGWPSVAIDNAGDFVIAWNSVNPGGTAYDIYAQRYNGSGVAQGTAFRVNTYTTDNQRTPNVAMDGAGDFVIAWNSFEQDGDLYGVYAQRYNALGVAQGAEFLVNVAHTICPENNPDVVMDHLGNFIITWNSWLEDGDQDGIYAQRYNAAGVPLGSEFRVNSYTTKGQIDPVIATDSAGDYVIVWASYQDGDGYGIYSRRYTM